MLFPGGGSIRQRTSEVRARADGEITRTFRTIRTRLRQAAPWQATRTTWDDTRGQGKTHYRSTVPPGVPQHTGKCGQHFPRGAGLCPAAGMGRTAPCSSRRRFHPPKDERGTSESRRGITRTFRTIPTACSTRDGTRGQVLKRGERRERMGGDFPSVSAGKQGEKFPEADRSERSPTGV